MKGEYSLVEPDGSIRIVEYVADGHSGFNAVVKKIGPSIHGTPLIGKVVLGPVIPKVGYAINAGLSPLAYGSGLKYNNIVPGLSLDRIY